MITANLIQLVIKNKGKLLLTLTIRTYDEPSFGIRCLSSINDRFAIDIYKMSFIIEMWFLRSGKN